MAENIEKSPFLADENSCTGCGVCYNICPSSALKMEYNKEGFIFPVIDGDKCTKCMGCKKICPIINTKLINNNFTKSVYISWNKNIKQRKFSSSGGVFPILANHILNNNGYVYGAIYDINMEVIHDCIDNKKNVGKLSGSKYVQSNIIKIYKDIKTKLEDDRIVLFSGLPCEITALYSYLDKKYDNFYTCELFCHGVPSPILFNSYVKYFEEQAGKKIKNINFRNKIISWNCPCTAISYFNKFPYIRLQAENPYFYWFGLHYSVRKSCFNCIYRREQRNADISLGDYWGIELIKPKINSKNGVSVIFINSEKGRGLLDQVASELYLEASQFSDVIKGNKYLLNNFEIPKERETFFETWRQFGIGELIKKYPGLSTRQRIKNKILRSLLPKA